MSLEDAYGKQSADLKRAMEEIESVRGLIEEIRAWDIANKMATDNFCIPIELRRKIVAAVGDPKEFE